MAQQALGGEDDERLLDGIPPLPAQEMEVRGGRRRIDHAHVALGAQGQEALDARARVLGPLALVAVGQEQDEAHRLAPLGLAAREELVDDDLGPVHEVAELGFPHHEGAVLGHRVAELEAHDRRFGEQAVVDLEADPGRGHAVERHVLAVVAGVVEDGVPLAEGAAPRVLAREPHRHALEQQGPEGQRLGGGPVHLALALEQLGPLLHEGNELGVDLEAFGQRAQDLQHGRAAAPTSRCRRPGAGSTGARLAILARGPASPSRCISAFFSAQSLSSSSREMSPFRTICSP